MKVLHLVPAMEQGGVETVVCDLNRAIVGNGWENVVVSAGGRLVTRIEADGGRHVKLDVKSKNPLTYLSRVWKLRRVIRAEKPNLVCAHSRVPAWLYVGVRKLESLLPTPSPFFPPWLTYAHGANSVSRYSAVMTKGDLTVTPSRFLADYLKANYGLAEEKLRIIHPAVDEGRFDPGKTDETVVARRRRAWGLSPGAFVVMAVGRITPVKGYDSLIRAFARLRMPGARLILVGDADVRHRPYLDSLKQLAAECQVADAVVFAGGETHVPECLTLASVVVSSNTRKPESYGLSMAEALMMERPVIAKAFGGACEIVRDGVDGLLVRDDDFAAAIERIRRSPLRPSREEAVSRLGSDRFREATVGLYRKLMV